MKISHLLKSHFASDVRGRGTPYFYSRHVRILQATPMGVWATVQGSSTYSVSLVLQGINLHMSCSCPFFEDRGVGCKHLWATILAADQRGALSNIASHRRVGVIWGGIDSPADWVDDGADEFDATDEDDFLEDLYEQPRRTIVNRPKKRTQAARKSPIADWRHVFAQIKQASAGDVVDRASEWPATRQLLYVIDGPASLRADSVALDLGFQDRKKDGAWTKPKFQNISQAQADHIRAELDVPIVAFLFGVKSPPVYGDRFDSYQSGTRFSLSAPRCRSLLPMLGRTGRLFVRLGSVKDEFQPLTWDDGPAWQFRLRVDADERSKGYQLTGWLNRSEERQPVTQPALLLPAGVVISDGRAAFVDDHGAPTWLAMLRREPMLRVPAKAADAFLHDLLLMAKRPPVDLPEDLCVVEEKIAPKPAIVIKPNEKRQSWQSNDLKADLFFEYGDQRLAFISELGGVFDAQTHRLILRDLSAEKAALDFLWRQGFRTVQHYGRDEHDFELPARLLPKAARALLEAGWQVEAEGKLYRRSSEIRIEVSTGIDWFDLKGEVRFDDQVATLPRLLQALKRGESTIQLDDGTFGMLPEEWLKKYGMLAGLGAAEGDQLRFARTQVGLLDALLASMPDVARDAGFRKAADELQRFEGIAAADAPGEFAGTLREYQREGLGWLHFLERFGFGGCLADDMGLGKTVQVLAFLAGRPAAKKKRAPKLPTLIVVPKSLVFNWKAEAARFAPNLRIVDHTGNERAKTAAEFPDGDVVITTYGILRRDVLLFKDLCFDYCILDEAQTVKNANTDQAKATRLVQAKHRLAMSGTPIENHLGELWSLFEFLNPGMLGHASVFKLAGGPARNPDPETRAVLAKGLRPFILRRTKQQVAKDLPEKTEQTLWCELEQDQRKLYDELRDHYRRSLLKTIDEVGLNRAKIQVLEALLRLRQAACHPGLIDKKKCADPSAKLELLMEYLREAIDEGQKTLVFSQFTSFLAIVRGLLDGEGIAYEYLDGKTRKRQEKVEHFQNNPDCKLFLISLKAGGVGLNLTAAEYVFLLDPWWNPAVEAQAIDRTHRIGQTKPVFAYRLIAKGTVEEKVLELQKTKRGLADAILNADNSIMSNLKREDLELLFS